MNKAPVYFDDKQKLNKEDLNAENVFLPLYGWDSESCDFSQTTINEIASMENSIIMMGSDGLLGLEQLAEKEPDASVTLTVNDAFSDAKEQKQITAAEAINTIFSDYARTVQAKAGQMYCTCIDELVEAMMVNPERWLARIDGINGIGFHQAPGIGKEKQKEIKGILATHLPWLNQRRIAIAEDFEIEL